MHWPDGLEPRGCGQGGRGRGAEVEGPVKWTEVEGAEVKGP